MTTLTAGAGTVLLGNFVQGASLKPVPVKADPFKQIVLGRTGIKTTLLGMGTGFNGVCTEGYTKRKLYPWNKNVDSSRRRA